MTPHTIASTYLSFTTSQGVWHETLRGPRSSGRGRRGLLSKAPPLPAEAAWPDQAVRPGVRASPGQAWSLRAISPTPQEVSQRPLQPGRGRASRGRPQLWATSLQRSLRGSFTCC